MRGRDAAAKPVACVVRYGRAAKPVVAIERRVKSRGKGQLKELRGEARPPPHAINLTLPLVDAGVGAMHSTKRDDNRRQHEGDTRVTKKFQVFVSSTYSDLAEERDQVIKAVLEMGHIPVGMEMFSAADEEQWKIIARQIDEIDYYIVIVAHRYGSVTAEGIGYTEKEFDYAAAKGIPILGFVIDDKAPWPNDRYETDNKSKDKLGKFKDKVKSRLIQFWTNKGELHGRFSIALMKAITANPRTGWVRANQAAGADVINELSRLSSENAALRKEGEQLRLIRDQQSSEVRRTIQVLSNNSRRLGARTIKKPKWEDVTYSEQKLSDIFHWIAPGLMDENSALGVAQNVALKLVGAGYLVEWPIGRNIVSDILADLAALELVEPSKKKHPIADKASYWQLTKLGKQTLREFRRVLLEEGLATPESGSDES